MSAGQAKQDTRPVIENDVNIRIATPSRSRLIASNWGPHEMDRKDLFRTVVAVGSKVEPLKIDIENFLLEESMEQ